MPSCGDGGGPAPVDGDVTVTLPLKTLHEVVAALEADRPPKRPTRLRLLRALVDGSDGALTLSQCLVRAAPATSAARAAALVVTKESCPTTPTESDAEFEPSGTAAPPVPPILIPPRLQLPSPKRAASAVVLVGCGEVARLYAHCLAGRCHYLITAVCDPDIAAATALAAHVNARQTQLYANAPACLVTASVAELVKCVPAEQRRLAVNLTPTQHHYTSTTELLLAGCHVWSEKPLAETVAEATELVQLASECGLELGCSPVSFWGAAQQTVARQLMRGAGARCNDAATAEEADHARSDSGALGTVRMCTASVLCGSWMPAADRIGGWLQHRRFRVGSLRDVAVYPLAVLTALFGPAVKVAAIVTAAMVAAHVDAWTVTVEFSTGATAIITSSLSLSAPAGDAAYGMTLRGDRGSLTLKALWNDDTGVTLLPDGGEDGAGLLRDVPLWRPPYASPPNAPPHPHACDWGCGIDLLAQSVDDSAALFNAEPDADVGPQARARHRTFTGAHGVHLVDMLEMAEASAAAPDHPSLGLTTTFDWPLPMPPPHALADALFGARRMSRVVLGTMRLAEISNPLAFLDAAWNLGCNTFDLAHVYGAKVEGIVGKWLAQRVGDHCTDSSRLLRPPLPGRPIGRADIILVGKGGHPYRDSRDKARLSHANLEKDITESLVRLGTDYLDVFLIHRDDPAAFPDVCVYARGIRFGVAAPAYGHCPLVDCGLESPQWPSDVLETIVRVGSSNCSGG